MSYLLDTHVAIWLDQSPERLPRGALSTLENSEVNLFVSTIALWEVVIKQSTGKLSRRVNVQRAIEGYGIREVVVSSKYEAALRELPLLHRAPFDRMMVAQAMAEGMVLVTADRRLWEYPVAVLRV